MKFTKHLAGLFLATLALPLDARSVPTVCGYHPEKWKEELHLSRQAARGRQRLSGSRTHSGSGSAAGPARTVVRDFGNVAVMEDVDGVIARRNVFNLAQRTVTFRPSDAAAARYRFETREASYDASLADSGTRIQELEDDDTREIALPFSFPFYGQSYRSVFVNSDGNLSFVAGDNATAERSLGRLTAGPPRIAGLFADLDPSVSSNGVRTAAEAGRFVVSWPQVREYSSSGTGPPQTFQIRLYPDGRIEIAWSTVTLRDAVVGISPGNLQGSSAVVSFTQGSSEEYSSSIGERFSGDERLDIVVAAQKFYETHEDAYDYLVFFNALGVATGDGAIAFEVTVRNDRSGFGDRAVNVGTQFGSGSRMQAFINMGPLTQYPRDPNATVGARGAVSGDTTLTILGHETGHLFLAFASVRESNDADARPMLGRDGSHWNFTFNSEASLLEGNRIRDNGPGVNPRFTTVATVEGYSALDQYLMGFIGANEVPPTFLVMPTSPFFSGRTPQVGVSFDGQRRDITIDEIIGVEGRRTPDQTVSQRRFRFAFVLVVSPGAEPTAAQLDQVETYRREFEPYFARVTNNRAFADTSLRRSLMLSMFPAAGVIAGGEALATVSLARAQSTDVTVLLRAENGAAAVPQSVSIPAGAVQGSFVVRGLRAGVEELTADVAGDNFEIASARVQVAGAAEVRLGVAGGNNQNAVPGVALPQPVTFRVSDVNNLPYPGVRVNVTAVGGGSVGPQSAVSNAAGFVQFSWTPGAGPLNELHATLEGVNVSAIATALGQPFLTTEAVVNSASFTSGLAPGSLATIFGANLTGGITAQPGLPLPDSIEGVRVAINGSPVPLVYLSDRQINFYVPDGLQPGTATLAVTNRLGSATVANVSVRPVAPGIFFDAASGVGAVLIAGTAISTLDRPAARGETIEIYATGLGPVTGSGALRSTIFNPRVTIGGVPAEVTFSGLAPGFVGLYQVNARVPGGAASGTQPLLLELEGARSNSVGLRVQ